MVLDRRESIIVRENPKSPVSEAYRVLRTNLEFASLDGQLKCFLFTSSGPNEGKSTTVSNLAVAAAQTGAKVLLIDGDLRSPTLHRVFQCSNRKGLTSVLVGRETAAEVIQQLDEANLFLLPTGPIPPNPAELLGTERMKELLSQVRQEYDYIYIDAPPVLAVTDAAVLSRRVDGVILVVASGMTHRKALIEARDRLARVNANLLGVALVRAKFDSEYQSYSYYYYSTEAAAFE